MKTNSLPRFLNPNYGYYYQPHQNMQHKNNEHLKHVKCPKCSHNFKLNILDNQYKYICTHCKYEMKFSEYQKRYNNINWLKISKKGIPLYSWKDNCPNCKNLISHISYCINNTFGDESLCIFKPILLGKCLKLDNFIMNVCNVVNMFPDDDSNLCAHIYCRHCDAPISYKNLVLSFLKQKSFGLEYIIKEKEISNLGLDPEDINKLLINLERY